MGENEEENCMENSESREGERTRKRGRIENERRREKGNNEREREKEREGVMREEG